MKLHDNQLQLLQHLARFNLLDYGGCLKMLDVDETGDRTALSYAFRPLTKNKYLSKRKDGSVSILAKGRALFPEVKPLIAAGGGASEIRRVIEVSSMAALMEKNGIPAVGNIPASPESCFIPSACWRNIAPGILSTTRFTGMLLVCRGSARIKAARNIIRQTMWNRRRLLQESCLERNKPTRWSRSPIKLRANYEHVYLTTPEHLTVSLNRILDEERYIQALCDENSGTRQGSQGIGDIAVGLRRLFVNPSSDLLKYVRYFSAVKDYLVPEDDTHFQQSKIEIELYIHKIDHPIAGMYPELYGLEGLRIYAYRS